MEHLYPYNQAAHQDIKTNQKIQELTTDEENAISRSVPLENVYEPLIEITIKQEKPDYLLLSDHEVTKTEIESPDQKFENVVVKQEYPERWMKYENNESETIINIEKLNTHILTHDSTNEVDRKESFLEISIKYQHDVKTEIMESESEDNLYQANTEPHTNKKHSLINNIYPHLGNSKKGVQDHKMPKRGQKSKKKKFETNLRRTEKISTHQKKKSAKRRKRTQTVFENNTLIKPYTCNICGKKYALKYNLNRHIDTHDDDKRFICDICQNKFGRKSHLVSHMKIHTGERPFPCNICHNRFAHKSTLTSHMMTHTGEKPYTCKVCFNKFAQKSTLVGHMKIHTGEKPFACELCESKFAHKSTLVSHMKTHTGEKPYSCNICENKFSLKSTLSRHMKTHIGEKPFSCCICHIKFGLKIHLEKHLQTHTDSE